MQRSGPSSPAIVIDANLAVWAAVPVLNESGIDVTTRFTSWVQAGIRFVAPALWRAECTNHVNGRKPVWGNFFRIFSAGAGRELGREGAEMAEIRQIIVVFTAFDETGINCVVLVCVR